jgi:phosphoribosylformylglycinamidine synthase
MIEGGAIVSAYAIGFGGIAEAVSKMAFGNNVGAEVWMDEANLFSYGYGSIIAEATEEMVFRDVIRIGETKAQPVLIINGGEAEVDLETLYSANNQRFTTVYPMPQITTAATCNVAKNAAVALAAKDLPRLSRGLPVTAYLPVFDGTNSDYDTAAAFRRAGARVTSSVFCNFNSDAIFRSVAEMKKHIADCQILTFSGGFSAGDEPDGSGKFIANVLNYPEIAEEIARLLERGGLILGVCNGFQALIKSGLLPYGRVGAVTAASPTLFRNDINRHISCMATTRVASVASPWLAGFAVGDEHTVAMSHGEGKFVIINELAQKLFAAGQVAFQYTEGNNINGSEYSIEGIVSPTGQILGKMGHPERYDEGLFKNISGNKGQDLWGNAMRWFK